jgi:hypothetical protein
VLLSFRTAANMEIAEMKILLPRKLFPAFVPHAFTTHFGNFWSLGKMPLANSLIWQN